LEIDDWIAAINHQSITDQESTIINESTSKDPQINN